MEVVLITRAIRRAKFQSSHHQHAVFYRPNVLPVARPVLGQLMKNINFIMDGGGSGGDNWSYKSCKAPVKSSPPTNQHPVFVEAWSPSRHPTNNVGSLKGKLYHPLRLTNFHIYGRLHYITSGKRRVAVCWCYKDYELWKSSSLIVHILIRVKSPTCHL